jgi:hypothetical protein
MKWIKHDINGSASSESVSAIIDTMLLMILMQKTHDRYLELKRDQYSTIIQEAEAGVWRQISMELSGAANETAQTLYSTEPKITACIDTQFKTIEKMAARMVLAVLIAVEKDCDPLDAMREVAKEMMEDYDNG